MKAGLQYIPCLWHPLHVLRKSEPPQYFYIRQYRATVFLNAALTHISYCLYFQFSATSYYALNLGF